MNTRRLLLSTCALASVPLLFACATPTVPLRVVVTQVERIDGGAMELRLMAKLRLQNANDAPVAYSGASVDLLLNGKTIGSGVADRVGDVPRFGEADLDIPITVSGLAEVRQAIGLYGAPDRKLDLSLDGLLNGARFGQVTFHWRGEMAMPIPRLR